MSSGKCQIIVVLALFAGGCVAPTTRQQAIDPELAAREAEKQRDLAIDDEPVAAEKGALGKMLKESRNDSDYPFPP